MEADRDRGTRGERKGEEERDRGIMRGKEKRGSS